jgi:hypothetical protein
MNRLMNSLEIAFAQLHQITSDLEAARAESIALGEDLLQVGVPWVEGNRLPALEQFSVQEN